MALGLCLRIKRRQTELATYRYPRLFNTRESRVFYQAGIPQPSYQSRHGVEYCGGEVRSKGEGLLSPSASLMCFKAYLAVSRVPPCLDTSSTSSRVQFVIVTS